MICPACKTNNAENQQVEFCVQCGSDMQVHRLLQTVHKELEMQSSSTTKASTLLAILHTTPAVMLIICATFGIFVGLQFLTFLERTESRYLVKTAKFPDRELAQLQQMNTIIKQELDLIMEQNKDNKMLQAKIAELTASQHVPALQHTSALQNASVSQNSSVPQAVNLPAVQLDQKQVVQEPAEQRTES